jgi:hypothetical protein
LLLLPAVVAVLLLGESDGDASSYDVEVMVRSLRFVETVVRNMIFSTERLNKLQLEDTNEDNISYHR